MQTYRATQTLSIGEGTVLFLTADQAKSRAHHLTLVGELDEAGGCVYRAMAVLQFKRGEIVRIEGSLPKGHEASAVCLTTVQPAGDPEPAAAPEQTESGKKSGKKGFFRK